MLVLSAAITHHPLAIDSIVASGFLLCIRFTRASMLALRKRTIACRHYRACRHEDKASRCLDKHVVRPGSLYALNDTVRQRAAIRLIACISSFVAIRKE